MKKKHLGGKTVHMEPGKREASGRHIAARWKSDPDVELMLRVKRGDHAAFRVLFEKHHRSVTLFAYRFVGDIARAEEVVQDAFLQLYRARGRYEPRARFVTYLYRIVTNLCLNRQRRNDPEDSLDAKLANGVQLADERQTSPEEYVVHKQLCSVISSCLSEIPDAQSRALELSRIEGRSHQEIAESLDTSVSAVKSLVFRGTQTLRRQLDEWLAA